MFYLHSATDFMQKIASVHRGLDCSPKGSLQLASGNSLVISSGPSTQLMHCKASPER